MTFEPRHPRVGAGRCRNRLGDVRVADTQGPIHGAGSFLRRAEWCRARKNTSVPSNAVPRTNAGRWAWSLRTASHVKCRAARRIAPFPQTQVRWTRSRPVNRCPTIVQWSRTPSSEQYWAVVQPSRRERRPRGLAAASRSGRTLEQHAAAPCDRAVARAIRHHWRGRRRRPCSYRAAPRLASTTCRHGSPSSRRAASPPCSVPVEPGHVAIGRAPPRGRRRLPGARRRPLAASACAVRVVFAVASAVAPPGARRPRRPAEPFAPESGGVPVVNHVGT
jgi:hypothetical protein